MKIDQTSVYEGIVKVRLKSFTKIFSVMASLQVGHFPIFTVSPSSQICNVSDWDTDG